ncbi:MAG: hypothetical protein HHAS10_01450 [Candidatus Altimarinota bacterium]
MAERVVLFGISQTQRREDFYCLHSDFAYSRAMSLYTKYRPRDWDSVVSQDYITTILRNSLKSGRVSHAYLFHGSRGTGKTTSARILAKALNCTNPKEGNPCHECENCRAFDNDTMLDIIEIDGASNNGVENVRELIERAKFEPNQGKYKIYIIDEVHMLSTGAFNALLKILEEPPAHVKFILATTEIDKVPETIRSRTLRFDFKKITFGDIIDRLNFVTKEEGIIAEESALQIIAKTARGGLRDALTLLEQNIIDNEVSTEHVRYTLSLIDEDLLEKIIEGLKGSDIALIRSIIDSLKERHIQVRSFFDQLMYRLRDLMLEHIDDSDFYVYSEIMNLIEDAYSRIRNIPDGLMLIEITLLRIVKRSGKPASTETNSLNRTQSSKIQEKGEPKGEKIVPPPAQAKNPEQNEETKIQPQPTVTQDEAIKNDISFSFPLLIKKLIEVSPALTTDLKTARFSLDGTNLTLIFQKKWNYERVNPPKIRNLIAETCSQIFGGNWEVLCELKESINSNIAEGIF